jgi:hypothetical protein
MIGRAECGNEKEEAGPVLVVIELAQQRVD